MLSHAALLSVASASLLALSQGTGQVVRPAGAPDDGTVETFSKVSTAPF